MTYKNNLLTLAAAGLLMLLPTACTDDLNGSGGTQGEGYGVAVQGISFFEAEPFAEDTLAEHQPTIETNVADAPDMDVMGHVTYDSQMQVMASRAAEATNGGVPKGSLEELLEGPNLARDLKKCQESRAKMSRAAGDTLQKERIVAGRKLAVPVRHKTTDDDSIQTRSFDVDDNSAIFVMGDSVGVYEVDGSGNIVNSNVKFVYNAGLWHSGVVLNYQPGHRYFAYHPYRTNAQLTALTAATGATTNYETFFSDFADKWPVSNDQGEYEKYHACDLLAGEATWNSTTATLGFPMHHLMGMLQLEFGTARIYLDWADEREDHYPYWWTDTVTTSLKGGMILLPKFGGKYRRITRPGSRLTVAAADNAWVLSFEAAKSISRGHYQHYDIGHTTSNGDEQFYQIFYNQLGDILLRDGRLIHRHDWRRITANHPVGIVVGTVYPAIDPFTGAIVGPVEDESYNMHSLEREYLYNMEEKSRTGAEPDTVTVVLKPQFIRCLVMSLKDVSYSSGSKVSFPGSWGAAWAWHEALSHMPVTHCVGVAANNLWSSKELASRVNNPWYPDMMSSSWNAVAECQSFNEIGPDKNGVSQGDGGVKQYTPNSGWFIGTCGQYQMAFCFGRERAFGDSWKRAHGEEPDNDGASPVWDLHLESDGKTHKWYNPQYNVTQRIGSPVAFTDEVKPSSGAAQGVATYKDEDYYERISGSRTYIAFTNWYPYSGQTVPTAYHDFDRINNAMSYATRNTSALYDQLSGEYTTSTLYCSTSFNDRFFPQLNKNWNYTYKYWNYDNWDYIVTVNVNLAHKDERGRCYYLNKKSTQYYGKIRPLMAL